MDATAAAAALKVLYDDQKVTKLFYDDNPFLALVPKYEDFGGSSYPVPVTVSPGQGRSAAIATAIANQTASIKVKFDITRISDYTVASITNEMLEASRTDKMAFLRLAEDEIDTKMQGFANTIAADILRSGTGSIGQVGTGGVSTGVITLADANSVVNFEVNQVLRCSNGTTDGNTVRAAKGYVIAVDRDAGTVTVASDAFGGNAATPASWAASEYLSIDGDINLKPKGIAAWIPATAPTSTAFFGVDRSIDPTRLGGIRVDGSGKQIQEAIVDASMRVAREGGTPDLFLTNFVSYGALEKELGTKVNYCDLKGPGEIGFRGIRINGHKGEIKVLADRSMPGTLGYMLQLNTWKLLSLNQAPHIQNYGLNSEMGWLRVTTADALEARACAYYNLACLKPGANARVSLSA